MVQLIYLTLITDYIDFLPAAIPNSCCTTNKLSPLSVIGEVSAIKRSTAQDMRWFVYLYNLRSHWVVVIIFDCYRVLFDFVSSITIDKIS